MDGEFMNPMEQGPMNFLNKVENEKSEQDHLNARQKWLHKNFVRVNGKSYSKLEIKNMKRTFDRMAGGKG